jgi:hypothetical protein
VEENLLSSSHARKAVALQLFTVLLPHMPASVVPVLLSKAFVNLLNISLKDSDSYLHKAATRCVDRTVEWASNSKAASAGTEKPLMQWPAIVCIYLVYILHLKFVFVHVIFMQ